MHNLTAAFALFAFAVFAPQGKEPPQRQEPQATTRPAPPPPDAALLPPIDEPFVAPVPRSDVLLRFDRPDPLEGFYQLRKRIVDGVAMVTPGDGYLAICRRHLMLQVSAPTGVPALPLLRAGVWKWRRVSGKLQLSVLLGHVNDTDGKIHLEQTGTVEVREMQQMGDVLRIYQNPESFLEFIRAE